MRFFLGIMALFFLGGCQQEASVPGPERLTRDATGFYGHMVVIDHPGPKAQIFKKGRAHAIWFPSVRDAFAYKILPGEEQGVQVIYVQDMGRANSWDKPQNMGIWIKAKDGFYVIDSRRHGGMGARETIPFSTRKAADKFVGKFGGRVVAYADIPRDYLLGDAGEYNAKN
ncbi:MAG: copper resistance protein CopZ [Alphaproteobacteria bacterium]|nr:copper resistance protein CopZ [Alphaproteobacteria bacterium]